MKRETVMEVDYECTNGDFISFLSYHLVRHPAFQILALGWIALVALTTLQPGYSWSPPSMSETRPLGLLLAFMFAGFLVLYKRFQNDQTVFGKKMMKLSPDGVSEVGEHGGKSFSWEAVSKIVSNKRLIMIYVYSENAFLVPKRIFKTEEQLRSFHDGAASLRGKKAEDGRRSLWGLWIVLLCAAGTGAAGFAKVRAVRDTERLRAQAQKVRTLYEPFLAARLAEDQGAVSWPEFEALTRMDKEAGIDCLTYFNKYGEVRWSRDAALISMSFDDYLSKAPPSTDAIQKAWAAASPIVVPLSERGRFDVSIPFMTKGVAQGILNIRCSTDGLARLIAKRDEFIGQGSRAILDKTTLSAPKSHHQAEQAYLEGVIDFQKGSPEEAKMRWLLARSLAPGYANPAALARLERDAAR